MKSLGLVPAILLTSCAPNGLKLTKVEQAGLVAFKHADAKPGGLVVINAVEYRGQFTAEGGCLVLLSDGQRYTPIFNNVEHLQAAVSTARNSEDVVSWSLAGGPMQGNALPRETLNPCQGVAFKVVSISDPRAARP